MTPAQVRRIQSITNLINTYYGTGDRTTQARVSYSVQEVAGGAVMLVADNSNDLPWYETWYSCHVIIEKQGGISRYNGSMSPKLVLPATPRNCTYDNPFKKKEK